MRVTLEPTEQFFRTIEGWPVRLWSGTDEAGHEVHAFIAAVAINAEARAELERLLVPIPDPFSVIDLMENPNG